MSGPKCARAELDPERAEALRRERERLGRIRRARESHDRDEKRQQARHQALRGVLEILQFADDLVNSMRVQVVDHYAAAELAEWEAARQNVLQELEDAQATLAGAEEQFAAASAAWRNNPESYQEGHFRQCDFSKARRLAEGVLQQGRQMIRVAEGRREEEGLREELDQKLAQAEGGLVQARVARAQFDGLEELAATLVDELDQQLANATQQVQEGDLDGAIRTACQVQQQANAQIGAVQAAFTAWQSRYDAAQAAVEEFRQRLQALDHEFMQEWAPGEVGKLQAQLRSIEETLAHVQIPSSDGTVTDQIMAQVNQLQTAIEAVQVQADEQYANELRRETIVDALIDVLGDMRFNVGAQLADGTNPLSDVLISAGHPSGREIEMRVDHNHQINMNLDDGVKGANCVEDVHRLIEGLQSAGIQLEMTDWGSANPERVKQTAGSIPQPVRQQRMING